MRAGSLGAGLASLSGGTDFAGRGPGGWSGGVWEVGEESKLSLMIQGLVLGSSWTGQEGLKFGLGCAVSGQGGSFMTRSPSCATGCPTSQPRTCPHTEAHTGSFSCTRKGSQDVLGGSFLSRALLDLPVVP